MNNELGLVDNVSTDHIADAYNQAEYNNTRPAVEGAPTLQTNTQLPGIEYGVGQVDTRTGGYVPAGTILEDNIYTIGDQGVQQVSSYSHNTSNEAERRIKLEEQRVRASKRSIYQTPPSSAGAPSITEEPSKPSEAQLSLLRKRDRLIATNNRLKGLTRDEEVTRRKLANIQSAIRSLRTEAEELA